MVPFVSAGLVPSDSLLCAWDGGSAIRKAGKDTYAKAGFLHAEPLLKDLRAD
jgi:hypothetical protein